MKFAPTQYDNAKARVRLEKLIADKKYFELRAIERKSTAQNRYFHLICGALALELGYSIEYTKQHVIKQIICPSFFVVERVSHKTGEHYQDIRSITELSKDEFTAVIDRVITQAKIEFGVYLPDPNDLVSLLQIEIEIERNQHFL